jgi:hypothetical protein
LVILSPLAFVAWILPATKKFWDMWWNQLIEWSIIGIPIAFFLYLALNSFSYLRSAFVSNLEMPGLEPATVGFLNEIFPFFVIIVFLILGFTIGLQTGAMGASGVISLAKKGARSTGAWTRKTAARRLAGPAAGITAGVLARAARGAEGLEKKTKWAKPLKWATRGLEMATVSPLIEYAAKQRRIKKPEAWDRMSITDKKMFISGKGTAQDQLVLASEMEEEGTFQKSGSGFQEKMLKVADKFKKDTRYAKEVGNIFDALPNKITKEMKIDFELAPIDPKAIDKETGKLKRDVEREKLELKIQGIASEFNIDENQAAAVLHATEIKSKDISKVTKDSVKSESFQLAMRKMKSPNLQALRNSFDAETVKAVLDEGKGLNTIKDTNEIAIIRRDNSDLVRWAYHAPAGRETLNWSKEWGKEEDLPKAIVTPGTKEYIETEEELKKRPPTRGRGGVGV